MVKIHDRLPVILKKSDEKIWLDESMFEPSQVLPYLKPYPTSLMEAFAISKYVNAPHNNSPEIIKPFKNPKF